MNFACLYMVAENLPKHNDIRDAYDIRSYMYSYRMKQTIAVNISNKLPNKHSVFKKRTTTYLDRVGRIFINDFGL